MATPLYKFLKGSPNDPNQTKSGFSTYVLPGAAEDISSAYQNDNYKMNFSKFSLLNLDISKMDLDNTDIFNTESLQVLTDKGDIIINSLRNYVANQEVVIRESLLNNNQTFYDPNQSQTTTERIFFKWLRKSGLIQFEPATPNDEYINATEFEVDLNLPEDYFKEYLWRERKVIKYTITSIEDELTDLPDPTDNVIKKLYKVKLSSNSNIKPLDTVLLTNNSNINIGFEDTKSFTVYNIGTTDQTIKNDIIYILSDVTLVWNNFVSATLELVYNRVVQYIGEISSINNAQTLNKNYTEVIAYIPDQTGQTSDILFRVKSDANYSPGLQFPILPSQDQPEIVGGEQVDCPMNTRPENYPGDIYAYFDVDQKYQVSEGLQDRKTGKFFGVYENDRNASRVAAAPYVYPEFDGTELDGITMDFDNLHYTKMNLPNKTSTNFDEFNSQSFNGNAPSDFEFNAVLWYYTVEDVSQPTTTTNESIDTNTLVTDTQTTTTTVVTVEETTPNVTSKVSTNLYAITFLNPVVDGQMATFKKPVANGEQDGLSYTFSINLNFAIDNEQKVEAYDETKTYSLFGFDLYNELVRRLTTTIDLFMDNNDKLIQLNIQVNNLKNLLYTQTDIRDVNSRIQALYNLLNSYKSLQIKDSDSIRVESDSSTNPPSLKLHSTDARFGNLYKYPVSLLYNSVNNTVLNNNITVPKGKDFMIAIINNDLSDITLDNNLNVVLDRDLDFKQTCEIKVYANDARFNKKLNLSIKSNLTSGTNGYAFINNINLPIDNNLNANIELDGLSKRWKKFPEIIPESLSIKKITDNYYLVVKINSNLSNSFKTGDVLLLENMEISYTDLVNNTILTNDISGQYEIVGEIKNSELTFLINLPIMQTIYESLTGNSDIKPLESTNLNQPVILRYNTGWDIKITCIDKNTKIFNEKYLISIDKL